MKFYRCEKCPFHVLESKRSQHEKHHSLGERKSRLTQIADAVRRGERWGREPAVDVFERLDPSTRESLMARRVSQ